MQKIVSFLFVYYKKEKQKWENQFYTYFLAL